MTPEIVNLIAKTAHEINRAYCQAIGDHSQPTWADAPEWQKSSVSAGVLFHLANPSATPEQSHMEWFARKAADGWTYGPLRDPVAKLHPCMCAYEILPAKQRAKDFLFRAVVREFATFYYDQTVAKAGRM